MHRVRESRRHASLLLRAVALIFWLGAGSTAALGQDIEPRAYSNIPQGVNFLVAGYAHAAGGLATDPTLPLENADLRTDAVVLGYARAIEIAGRSGKFDVNVPFAWTEGDADYVGEARHRRVTGFGDPRLRLSLNLVGAPALSLDEFRSYRQDTIVGVSVQVSAPFGQYDGDRLINVGNNRWFVKSELGLSKALRQWTLELAAAATVFGDNDDFLGGHQREQDPIYSVQGGLVYGFNRGIWMALNGTYYTGGRTRIDGIEGNDLQQNSLVGLTAAFPLTRQDSLKLYASTGLSTRIGTDVDTISLAWQRRWGAGL